MIFNCHNVVQKLCKWFFTCLTFFAHVIGTLGVRSIIFMVIAEHAPVLYSFWLSLPNVVDYSSNLPNKYTDLITEVWEKTLIDVLWIFLVSENYIAWLTWFLVFTSYRGYQELSQSSKIIFTSQKYSQNIDQGFLHKVR